MTRKLEITDYTLKKSTAIRIECDGKYLDGGLTDKMKFIKRKGGWILSIRNAEFSLSTDSLKDYINSMMRELDAHRINYSVTAWGKNPSFCWFMMLGEKGNRRRAI